MRVNLLVTLFLFCSFTLANSQDSSTVKLLKPNLILEYQTYDAEYVGFGKFKQFQPSTRLVYTIKSVKKESVDKTYISILKEGVAFNSEKLFSWQKQEQISITKDKMLIPLGFYFSDTTFLCDVQRNVPHYQKRPMVYSAWEFESEMVSFPFKVNKEEQLDIYNFKVFGRINDPDIANMDAFVRGKSGPDASAVAKSKKRASYTGSILTRKVIGITKTTTPAGTFECYKILMVLEVDIKVKNPRTEQYVYFSPEYGVVKIEPVDMNKPAQYIVLMKIRNK